MTRNADPASSRPLQGDAALLRAVGSLALAAAVINIIVGGGIFKMPAALVGAGSSYRLFFSADYGTASAVTVKNASGVDIAGIISASPIPFDFDYDGDTLGGTAGTDKAVTLIGIKPGSGKFAVATGTLTRSKAISLSLVGEADRAYN